MNASDAGSLESNVGRDKFVHAKTVFIATELVTSSSITALSFKANGPDAEAASCRSWAKTGSEFSL